MDFLLFPFKKFFTYGPLNEKLSLYRRYRQKSFKVTQVWMYPVASFPLVYPENSDWMAIFYFNTVTSFSFLFYKKFVLVHSDDCVTEEVSPDVLTSPFSYKIRLLPSPFSDYELVVSTVS